MAEVYFVVFALEYWATQYVLNHIINVPTTGTGRVKYQARTLVGID